MSMRLRSAVLTSLLAAGLAAGLAGGPARAASRTPSPSQIRTAVRRAESSRRLWATINICDTRRYPRTIGLRGQMPTLGFSASLSMHIESEYWFSSKKRFEPIPGVAKLLTLGRASSGLRQGGASFPLNAHAGLLSGMIVFEWKLGGRVLGQTTRQATAGHRDADTGNPPHFSAARCTIR